MNLFRKFIDVIYPPRCPVCGIFLAIDQTDGDNHHYLFCSDCMSGFKEISSPYCSICGTPFKGGLDGNHVCEGCLRKRPFYDVLRAPYHYDGALMTAIHHYKYGARDFIADALGPMLARFAEDWLEKPNSLLTMPVPLHPKRLRERGFNQSLLLARHVVKKLHTELDFLSLRRIRYTAPQTGLGSDERRKNVRGAFMVIAPEKVKGMRVLLVDDVATTGNTMSECARMLKKVGAKEVLCLVLARAKNQ